MDLCWIHLRWWELMAVAGLFYCWLWFNITQRSWLQTNMHYIIFIDFGRLIIASIYNITLFVLLLFKMLIS